MSALPPEPEIRYGAILFLLVFGIVLILFVTFRFTKDPRVIELEQEKEDAQRVIQGVKERTDDSHLMPENRGYTR